MTAVMRRFLAMALAAIMITVTGCSVSMESIPVPDGVTGDTYEVNIEFSNVLNIPGGAKVLSNGSQVGRLERVKLDN
ncbi:mammalian cell entry protein, partial [Mycobacterium kansasii]